jgi:energy-coupling factor transporter ATP-binding protein EcfA2
MDLIQEVAVRRFRSIPDLNMTVGELTALVGGNGSGKSNILRALNLYFNGEVEAGDALNLQRDVHRPWSKKKPVIEVGAHFKLSKSFSIHKSLTESFKKVGITAAGEVSIWKSWSAGTSPDEPPVVQVRVGRQLEAAAENDALVGDDARVAERFLRLIHYRYLPNHEHPSQVLLAEQAAVQEELIKAVRRKRTKDGTGTVVGERFDAALEAMSDAAGALVEPINAGIRNAAGPIESLQLATPEDWAQVVWSLTFQLKATGMEPLSFPLHGSGSQSQAMYQMLYFLDTQFAASFGWHQATVWALEEPESFLHADLKNELVMFLIEKCAGDRFQALLTTHDLVIASAATERQWIELASGDSRATALTAPQLADRSISAGISTFVHPLHLTAMKPTLLLEGPSDVWYTAEAYRHAGRINPWDIRYLDEIEHGAGGGKDPLKKYLKSNQAALRARPTQSPVVVVLDWEVSEDEVRRVNDLLAAHPLSSATRWPADKANPKLAASWVGIERFLGTDLVVATATASPNSGMTMTVGVAPMWELAPQRKNEAKALLLKECQKRNEKVDLDHLIALLDWLEAQLPSVGGQTPIPGV